MFALLTGLLAGFIHVWTGPDHLTAVPPLVVRRPQRAWIPGVRWGFGHSAGVAVVGLLSLLLRDLIPVEWLSSWGERLVGVMLFGIGLWALHQAFKKKIHAHQHEHDSEQHVHFHAHHHGMRRRKPHRIGTRTRRLASAPCTDWRAVRISSVCCRRWRCQPRRRRWLTSARLVWEQFSRWLYFPGAWAT